MKSLMIVGIAALIILAPVAAMAIDYSDYGDGSSSALTTRAWEKFALGTPSGYDDAIELTDACIYLYAGIADTQQAAISGDYFNSREPDAGTTDDDTVFSNWALNDVGTCWFIRGLAQYQKGQVTKARASFNNITNGKDRSATVHEAYIDAFAVDLGSDDVYGTADDFFWSVGKGAQSEVYKIDGDFPSAD